MANQQTLNIDNFANLNVLARTNLTSDILTPGQTTLPALNGNNFAAGPVLVGAPGGAVTELCTISGVAAESVTLAGPGTTLPHNNNDPLLLLFGSQLRIYFAADVSGNGVQPPDANFNLLATIAINPNGLTTPYTDTTNPPGTWYKYTYYNPGQNSETTLADSVAVQSGVTHYCSLDDIRDAAGLEDAIAVSDSTIAKFRDAAEKEINGSLLPVYDLPLPLPINPIIVQITKNIAAGELIHEQYKTLSPAIADEGTKQADKARIGGGAHTSLADLVDRDVVLEDANFTELTEDEGHGFGGFPDGTAYPPNHLLPKAQRMPHSVDQEY